MLHSFVLRNPTLILIYLMLKYPFQDMMYSDLTGVEDLMEGLSPMLGKILLLSQR